NPLGAQLYFARDEKHTHMTIVGVVGDVKESGPDQETDPAIYLPLIQKQEPWRRWAAIIVRSGDSSAVSQAIKNVVWSVDPQIPVNKIMPLTELLADSLAPRRFNTVLLVIFAATALLLATVGIYGVISFTVTQRTQEIGVRIALGASTANVSWMVLKQGLGMA